MVSTCKSMVFLFIFFLLIKQEFTDPILVLTVPRIWLYSKIRRGQLATVTAGLSDNMKRFPITDTSSGFLLICLWTWLLLISKKIKQLSRSLGIEPAAVVGFILSWNAWHLLWRILRDLERENGTCLQGMLQKTGSGESLLPPKK